MSIVNVLARVDEIQSRIRTLAPEPVTANAAAGATTSTSAGAFATAVQDVIGAAVPAGGTVSGEDVVARAKNYLGVPYVFGGEDASGMDCSGLVQRVLADLGIDAPRVVQDQADIGVEVGSLAEARPGDLLVTNGEKHIVIYAGDGKIIHAPSPGKNVELRNNYLTDADIQTIRRVVPSRAEIAAAATPAVNAASVFAAAAAPLMASLSPASAAASAGARVASMFAAVTPAGSPAAAAGLAAAAGPPPAADPAVATSATPVATPLVAAAAAATSGATLMSSAARAMPAPGTERSAADAAAAVAAASVASAAPAAAEPVAAAPPPAAAAPANRTPFAQQVTPPVLSLAGAGEGEHTLTLTVSPDNLGPVTVKAQITGSSIVIELAAPTETGREALRSLLVDLRRDLAGLAASSSVVLAAGDTSATGNGQHQNQNPSGAAWAGGFGSAAGSTSSGQSGAGSSGATSRGDRDAAPDTPSPVPAPAPAAVGSGIDLFA
ncbi:C40 family peptidase [Microbacterium sp. Sa4CUA7]|uniref:C40 family peptidase n=1 Tax=Microbacterium pullorum TaxID=2762236 RepID=A0ABR8S2W7_9MICO|nr:NlpC/P60 family protein [Microbacterium pullorum]MBD7957434.1 C40 family peptidase [Microbacterium pullorum]